MPLRDAGQEEDWSSTEHGNKSLDRIDRIKRI